MRGPPFKYNVNCCREEAAKKGGKFISELYIGFHKKHIWECANGHQWLASLCNILDGRWCPYCSKNRSRKEEQCRYIFEWLTNERFPTNCTIIGGQYELDGYCLKLNVAFEYNGEQHYRQHSFFAKTEADLQRIQERDRNKRQRCLELGIRLITIPYTIFEQKEELTFIISELEKLGVPIRKDIENFSYEEFWKSKHKINVLRDYAKKKGGELLSTVYEKQDVLLEWKCKKGHIFKKSWEDIKWLHRWCPDCAVWGAHTGPTSKKSQEYITKEVSEIGLIPVSQYKNRKTKMEFKCIYCGEIIYTSYGKLYRFAKNHNQSMFCECPNKKRAAPLTEPPSKWISHSLFNRN